MLLAAFGIPQLGRQSLQVGCDMGRLQSGPPFTIAKLVNITQQFMVHNNNNYNYNIDVVMYIYKINNIHEIYIVINQLKVGGPHFDMLLSSTNPCCLSYLVLPDTYQTLGHGFWHPLQIL